LVSSPRNERVAIAKPMPGDVELKVQACLSRPVLRNVATDFDNKGVTDALRKRLKEVAGGGGPGGSAVYVDAEDLDDAIRPAGTYTVDNDKIAVRLRLLRNEEVVAELPPVEGTTNDLAGLADRIAVAIARALAKR